MHPIFFALLMSLPMSVQSVDYDLLTVAEKTDYHKTARYDEVIDLLDRIESQSQILRRAELGTTSENRSIPLVILANPPVQTAEQAKASGKAIVFAFANIHAGEVCGKEALLMLTRELAAQRNHPFFENLIIVFAPIYNADGNERMAPDNRRGQIGPDEMGQRPNAQGLDLNRDYIKLESPEARALVNFFTEWDPHITIDCHTTNGSYHRYTLTYDYPLNPSGHPAPIEFIRDQLLPAVTDSVRQYYGYEMFFYGNFNRDHTTWTTYSALPRFGGPYQGLRGQMAILSEAYSYATFKDRVLCTREFVRSILEYASEHHQQIKQIHDQARLDTIAAGENPQPSDLVGLRHKASAYDKPVILKGYVEKQVENGRPRPTEVEKDYTVVHLGRFEPTLSVRRPYAYIIPAGLSAIVEKLKQHGIAVEPFAGSGRFEVYTIEKIHKQEREFQGHKNILLDARADILTQQLPAGSWIVRTAQPLGTLAVYLLEPQSEDGLAAWNFFDEHISVGKVFPILRVQFQENLD
ncbi:MAG: M14 family metallopeptidase [Planctomycetes bacterium]|nr:M14 family metallopeptidase [Planctomycetota bacterium]